MKLAYDPAANAAFVEVREIMPGAEKEFVLLDHAVPDTSVIASFSALGALLGLEILGARKVLAPELLDGRSDTEFEIELAVRRSTSGDVTSVALGSSRDGRHATRIWFDADSDCEMVYAVLDGATMIGFEIRGDLRGELLRTGP